MLTVTKLACLFALLVQDKKRRWYTSEQAQDVLWLTANTMSLAKMCHPEAINDFYGDMLEVSLFSTTS